MTCNALSLPRKKSLLSIDKGDFFKLSVALTRNVKYVARVKTLQTKGLHFISINRRYNITERVVPYEKYSIASTKKN